MRYPISNTLNVTTPMNQGTTFKVLQFLHVQKKQKDTEKYHFMKVIRIYEYGDSEVMKLEEVERSDHTVFRV